MIIYLDIYGVWNEVFKDCIEKLRRAFPVDCFLYGLYTKQARTKILK